LSELPCKVVNGIGNTKREKTQAEGGDTFVGKEPKTRAKRGKKERHCSTGGCMKPAGQKMKLECTSLSYGDDAKLLSRGEKIGGRRSWKGGVDRVDHPGKLGSRGRGQNKIQCLLGAEGIAVRMGQGKGFICMFEENKTGNGHDGRKKARGSLFLGGGQSRWRRGKVNWKRQLPSGRNRGGLGGREGSGARGGAGKKRENGLMKQKRLRVPTEGSGGSLSLWNAFKSPSGKPVAATEFRRARGRDQEVFCKGRLGGRRTHLVAATAKKKKNPTTGGDLQESPYMKQAV